MSAWKNEVVIVTEVRKHENADLLDVVLTSMGDYPVITGRNQWKVGDHAGYISSDSVVPSTEQFYFLCPQNSEAYEENGEVRRRNTGPKYGWREVPEVYRRIKCKKIRSVFSEGLLIPVPTIQKVGLFVDGKPFYLQERIGRDTVADNYGSHVFDTVQDVFDYDYGFDFEKIVNVEIRPLTLEMAVGEDISEVLGLTKYEEADDDESLLTVKKNKISSEQAEKNPEGWNVPYYDKESLKRYIACIREDEEIVLSEKINGACSTFCHDGEKLYCKSRNYFKREQIFWTDGENVKHTVDSTDQWWDLARRLDLKNKLSAYPFLALYGECAGQVKGFRYDAKIVDGRLNTCLYVFDVYDVKNQRFFDYDDRVDFIKSLGLTPAPELYRGLWKGKDEMFPYAEGKTRTKGNHIIEGFVLNTVKERFEEKLHSRMSVKLVGEGYSLSKK